VIVRVRSGWNPRISASTDAEDPSQASLVRVTLRLSLSFRSRIETFIPVLTMKFVVVPFSMITLVGVQIRVVKLMLSLKVNVAFTAVVFIAHLGEISHA
jgi:hypothetical protein